MPLDASLQDTLVIAANERHPVPSRQPPEAYFGQAFETQHPLIVSDRPIRSEDGASLPVPPERLDRLGDSTNRHLCRQPELIPNRAIGKPMDGDLPEDPGSETLFSGIGCRFVEDANRRQKVGLLVGIGDQLELQGEFHADNVSESCPALNVSR